MAFFYWKCTQCEHSGKKLSRSRPELGKCPECSSEMDFVDNSSTRIVEVRDNGFMYKKVEQLANIIELKQERSTKNKG
jgi:transcription initiation factor IIE alpha subunit